MLGIYQIMYSLLKTLICSNLILPLAPQVRAAPDSSRTSQTCTTEWDYSLDGPLSTVTSTEIQTSSNLVVETVTPAITRMTDVPMVIIPTPRLSFITVPQITRTITELTTETSIVTETVAVATITETVIDDERHPWIKTAASTFTVTIPTPSGFRRPSPAPFGILKREITGRQGPNTKTLEDLDTPFEPLASRETNRKLHRRVTMPSRVVCTDFITVMEESTRTITGTSTATIDLPSSAHTLYAGLVRSTVVPPDAPPDALITTTSTITEEALTTTFVTERAELHIPVLTTVLTTVYDACSKINLLNNLHREVIAKVRDGPAFGAVELFEEAQTPFDCCVACITHPNCGGTSFRPRSNASDPHGRCRGLLTSGDCNPANIVGYFDRNDLPKSRILVEEYYRDIKKILPYDALQDGIYISSGHCGHLEQGDK